MEERTNNMKKERGGGGALLPDALGLKGSRYVHQRETCFPIYCISYGNKGASSSVSDVSRYVTNLTVIQFHSQHTSDTHTVMGSSYSYLHRLFFRKVAYTRHDVTWLMEQKRFN
jgi:hypothetical protein